LRASTAIAIVALLVLAAGCGGSHSTAPTTSATKARTVTRPVTNPTPKHFDKVLAAKLTSAASVPKGPPHGSGSAVLRLSTKARQACWTITVHRIDKPLSAHVRKAPPGKVGPVIIPLGARFSRTGCVILPLKSIKAVSKSPAAYYVDVLTRKHLNGALRGQLHTRG
jgi:hypothetical protein